MDRYRPKTQAKIDAYIAELKWEVKDGGNGVADCEECGKTDHFVIEAFSDDGVVHVGYCLNPECGFEMDMDRANEAMLDRRLEREG